MHPWSPDSDDTLGHEQITCNQDRRYLVKESLRVVSPILRRLHVADLSRTGNQSERRH